VRDQAHTSVVATFHSADAAAKSGHPATAQFLAQQGREAFALAFGRTMLLGSVVIFLNAAIVWRFQGRHRGAVAPEPQAVAAVD